MTFCCRQPLDVQLHNAQTYGLKAQVGVIGGVLPGFVTGIHKDSVRRWNLWFPSAGVFAKVLAGRATGTEITLPPIVHHYNSTQHCNTETVFIYDPLPPDQHHISDVANWR